LKLPAFFLFLAVLLSSGGCGAPEKERRSLETDFKTENHPVQESWNIKLSLYEAGFRNATVQAGHATEYRNKEKNTYYIDQRVTVIFYEKDGTPPTTLNADKAVILPNHDIEASGNVVITAENNTVIRTTAIKRTAADRMIRSNRHVTISGPKGTLEGEGFESDHALKRYRIFRGSGEALFR